MNGRLSFGSRQKKKKQQQQFQLIIETNRWHSDIEVTCFHYFFFLFNFRLQQVMMIRKTVRDLLPQDNDYKYYVRCETKY